MLSKNIKILKNYLRFDFSKNFISLVALFYALFFLPAILYGNYYYDDSILSEAVFTMADFYGVNLWEQSLGSFFGFYYSGRLYGLYSIHYVIFYLFRDHLSYHIVKAIFNLIAVLSFAWLIKLITKNSNNARIFIFLTPLTFLISLAVDPLISMGLSMQYTAIFVALASGFYILGREKNQKRYKILSTIFFVFAFFYYEFGICIVPIFIVLAMKYRFKSYEVQNFSTSTPYNIINKIHQTGIKFKNYLKIFLKAFFIDLGPQIIIFLIWVLACIYIRINSKFIYDGIEFGFNLEFFILAWIQQISLSFPLAGFVKEFYVEKPENYQIFLAVILVIISYQVLIRLLPKVNIKGNYRDIILIGLVLILVPSGISSLSGKYQTWVLSDNHLTAFIQVFLQFFGFIFLLIAYLSYIFSTPLDNLKKNILIKFLAGFIALTIGLINIFNYSAIHKKNNSERQNDTISTKKALSAGILNDMPKVKFPVHKYYDALSFDFYRKDLAFYFELNKQKKQYQLKEIYRQDNKLILMVWGIYNSINFNFYYPSFFHLTQVLQNDKKLVKNISAKDNFYYLENGYSEFYSLGKKFLKKNLQGFLIGGKIHGFDVVCKNDAKCHYVIKIFSPKIFIDKDYLFKIDFIINELNRRFGENILDITKDQIIDRVNNSKDGAVFETQKRIYNLNRF